MERRSKYNVDTSNKEKRTCDGIVFDSIDEMRFYRDWLCPKVESGEITEYELQKKYELQPKFINKNGKPVRPIDYVADFVVTYKDGSVDVFDVKGCPDSLAKTKRKLFWYVYPDTNYIWIAYSKKYGDESNGYWMEYDELNNCRNANKRKRNAELKEKDNGEEKW